LKDSEIQLLTQSQLDAVRVPFSYFKWPNREITKT
jgi:hypothetical protein